jgi:hypothetical protein
MVALKNFFTRILLNLLEAFIVEVFSKLIEMIKDKIKDYYRNKMENENDDQKRKDRYFNNKWKVFYECVIEFK